MFEGNTAADMRQLVLTLDKTLLNFSVESNYRWLWGSQSGNELGYDITLNYKSSYRINLFEPFVLCRRRNMLNFREGQSQIGRSPTKRPLATSSTSLMEPKSGIRPSNQYSIGLFAVLIAEAPRQCYRSVNHHSAQQTQAAFIIARTPILSRLIFWRSCNGQNDLHFSCELKNVLRNFCRFLSDCFNVFVCGRPFGPCTGTGH